MQIASRMRNMLDGEKYRLYTLISRHKTRFQRSMKNLQIISPSGSRSRRGGIRIERDRGRKMKDGSMALDRKNLYKFFIYINYKIKLLFFLCCNNADDQFAKTFYTF